jgi:hypothetical protein
LQLSSLKKELEAIQQQLQRIDRLIHIADPDGWYKPPGSSSSAASSGVGSDAAAAAAAAARAAAKQALEADRQRRAAAVAAQRAGWAAAHVSMSNVLFGVCKKDALGVHVCLLHGVLSKASLLRACSGTAACCCRLGCCTHVSFT